MRHRFIVYRLRKGFRLPSRLRQPENHFSPSKRVTFFQAASIMRRHFVRQAIRLIPRTFVLLLDFVIQQPQLRLL